jgi:hypothetical protein|tara:strand:+ start:1014 stop:1244 length:231 start_codon:yes stop_codon:yes gene_type:complete
MRLTIIKALKSYLRGHIQKHVANVNIHLENSSGVAEHSDHIETIEKELDVISSYEDKLNVLIKYFDETNNKEVLNG